MLGGDIKELCLATAVFLAFVITVLIDDANLTVLKQNVCLCIYETQGSPWPYVDIALLAETDYSTYQKVKGNDTIQLHMQSKGMCIFKM